MSEEFIGCTIKTIPQSDQVESARVAINYNPLNRPPIGRLIQIVETLFAFAGRTEESPIPSPEHIAVLTKKYWGVDGVKLTVGFPFDSCPADLQARIVSHMNAWSDYCNVKFMLSSTDPQVRITRADSGYWSYLGVDILSIPRNQPTLCLQGFTMSTPESEFRRVVRHETGHTLGSPHEHMRQELINRLDRQKTIAYFQATQGWSPQTTIQQVLTPISEASIRGTPNADQDSIMTYQLPASITIDGQPIRGGANIDQLDASFMGTIYPLPIAPPPPPPPPPPPVGGYDITKTIRVTGTGTPPTITVS